MFHSNGYFDRVTGCKIHNQRARGCDGMIGDDPSSAHDDVIPSDHHPPCVTIALYLRTQHVGTVHIWCEDSCEVCGR